MIVSDADYFFEIEPGVHIYFAVKDQAGEHVEVACTDWYDLIDTSATLADQNTLINILEKAYKCFEFEQLGGRLSPEIIANYQRAVVEQCLGLQLPN